MKPTAADRAAAARRKKPPNSKGCKPHDDVCLAHCMPLVCAHGCEEAAEHGCKPPLRAREGKL